MILQYGYRDADIIAVVAEIEKLPFLHQIAFGASICERLMPNSNISRESNQEKYSVLRQALDEVWLIVNGQLIDSIKLFQLKDDLETVVPEYDDSDSEYILGVDYVAGSIYYLIDMCLQTKLSDSQVLERFITCAYSIFSSYIVLEIELAEDMAEAETDDYFSNKSIEEQRSIIHNHPFILQEMTKENEDLQRIKETPFLTLEFLESLRTSSQDKGKS